ncbi:MAG: TetR family transcriptional regulator [delta proteobacterium ML8_D]|nr:MAG: TetR family transcriptional regulator [delta proteobacterium ML8_D]
MPAVKLSRREREKLRQRRQMLAAALELFSEKGFHNVSMHEIAKRAEFAIGTLYKFFKNKEDLYKALLMEKAEEYHHVLMGVLSEEKDVLTVIEGYIVAKSRLFTDNLPILRLYFAETRGASFNIRAGLDQDIQRLYDKFILRLVSVLQDGVRRKVLREMDPYHMAVALEGLTNAFLFCWTEDPQQHPYEANVSFIRDMFLNGVLNK